LCLPVFSAGSARLLAQTSASWFGGQRFWSISDLGIGAQMRAISQETEEQISNFVVARDTLR
jgi:hypothetical protein